MPFVVGETVGPYRIVEQLGQGGMATVFKAYHPALDRYVALKALHPAFSLDPNFLTRFQREAQVVARLEHPNIVPVHDYAEHEGRPYLVMKFIQGETLKAHLSETHLSLPEITRIIESVGAGLSYAHAQGVLHRDVKPSNVLLATDGRIYLADFGLARMAQAGESTISSDMMMGTPQYISPEQARGQRDLDNGTDIYSFGVLIYELVVGKVPFSADTPYSIIHDHIYAPLPLPRTVNPNIPEPVERLLLKALAKERLDRFADVDALVAAWEQAVTSSPVAPVPPAEPTDVLAAHPPVAPAAVNAAQPAASAAVTPEGIPVVPEAVSPVSSAVPPALAPVPPLPGASPVAVFPSRPSAAMVTQTAEEAAPKADTGVSPTSESAPSIAGRSTGQAPAAVSTAETKRRRSNRIWIGIAVIVILCCLCGGVLFLYTSAQEQAGGGATGLPGPTAATLPAATRTEQPGPTQGTLPLPGQPVSGKPLPLFPLPPPVSVEDAQKRVKAAPQDPQALLTLALAYVDQNMTDEAEDAYRRAIQASGGDTLFLVQAGDYMLQKQAWLGAARAYVQALKQMDASPPGFVDRLNQSIYMAAENPESEKFLADLPVEKFHPGVVETARARWALKRGDARGVIAVVKALRERYPDLREAQLLDAEILLKGGRTDLALANLRALISDPGTPEWIRQAADAILKSIKN